MKRTALLSFVVAMLVAFVTSGICQQLSGDPASRVERLTAMYDFANWPGKDGLVRDGFKIGADVLPPELELVRAGDPRAYVDPDSGYLNVRRRYIITRADRTGRITVDVTVAGTCVQAQERLIGLLVNTSMAQPPLIPKGAEYGLDLSDVCFVLPGKDGGFTAAMWVRNNVLVRIAAHIDDMRPFVEELARALDAAISRRATFKTYAECVSRPVITGVARVTGSEEVQRLEVDWKAVETEVPQGEKVEYVPSHRLFPKGKLKGRGWPSYQVAISESNLMGFPLSGAAAWKTNGPRGDKVNTEVDAFLKTVERPAGPKL